jgi:uracil-DNA glycosylase
LSATIGGMQRLRVIVALGRIAHETVLSSLAVKRSANPFSHGGRHILREGLALYDSYHCSRYNTNTGVLTPEMFRDVLARAQREASR